MCASSNTTAVITSVEGMACCAVLVIAGLDTSGRVGYNSLTRPLGTYLVRPSYCRFL